MYKNGETDQYAQHNQKEKKTKNRVTQQQQNWTGPSTRLRFWRPWRTEKNEAPLQILKFQKIDFHLKILQ